ncbi:SAM-dependent methyltransferase [Kutzneria viridogrisea]
MWVREGSEVERPSWAPVDVDVSRPSSARVYDYYLGGAHNFAVDRAVAEQTLRLMPGLDQVMRLNRAFLRRSVRMLVRSGVTQFLDLGAGIPTAGNVHEVAQAENPAARVLYVDVDPVAVAHSNTMLAGNERAAALQADIRDPKRIFDEAQRGGVLELDRPVAVLMNFVLHFVPDSDDPEGVVAVYRQLMSEGSYLVLSHAGFDSESDPPSGWASAVDLYDREVSVLHFRRSDRVARLFSGFDLLEPGVVRLPLWRPDPDEEVPGDAHRYLGFAGVGRKPCR